MPTITRTVATHTDNTTMASITDNSGRNPSSGSLWQRLVDAGSYGTNDENSAAMRFTNITIPPGATIISATLSLTHRSAHTITGTLKLYLSGHASDHSPSYPETGSDHLTASARPRTAAHTIWNPTGTLNDEQTIVITCTSIVQEIINRSGWTSGNALSLILDTHEDCTIGEATTFYSTEYTTDPARLPTLTINYTTGSGGSDSIYATLTPASITATIT